MTETLRGEAQPQPEPLADQDRTISPVAGRLGDGKTGKAIALAALVVGGGVFLQAIWKHGPQPKTRPLAPAAQVVAFEPIKPDTPAQTVSPTLTSPGPGAPTLDPAPAQGAGPLVPAIQGVGPGGRPINTDAAAQSQAQTEAGQLQAIRSAPILAFSRSVASDRMASMAPSQQTANDGGAPNELDQLRRGSAIGLAHATRLPDRDFLIAAGTSIPCTLQTAMDTSAPGYVSCLIGSDIYSDNGAVILMEKGAKVFGEYRSGMRQGQHRLFVLWTRAVTPQGVAIGLASPASDALGRAGFDGNIDSHFWERFGGALLLSIVDDTASAVASRNGPNSTATRVPSDAAAVAVQDSVGIAPSVIKPQGSQVAIFAAQDFDFSSVYALKAR